MWPSVVVVYEDTSAIAVFNKQILVYRVVSGVEANVVRPEVCSVVGGCITGGCVMVGGFTVNRKASAKATLLALSTCEP